MNTYSASTASKQPHRFPANYPKRITKGKGALVWDENGNKYLDFMCSLGPIILGHRYPAVDNAVIEAIGEEGTSFSLPHEKEWVLADLLCEMVPCAEMVRFATNGVDVTSAAIRLARHITGRELILSFSYHGCSDVFMACTPADKGVPLDLKKTITDFDYNDIDRVKELFDKNQVAGVIIEMHTIRPPIPGFLEEIRALCDKHGALLIADEVVTFPRYPGYSAQNYFKVIADLACVSKGMANGYPISALVGKREYMKHLCDGEVFFSTTFGGNNIGVTAAIATLKEVKKRNVPARLCELGKRFRDQIKPNNILKVIGSMDSRLFFEFANEADRWKLYQETIKDGLFFSIPIFFNLSMTPRMIDLATSKINKILDRFGDIKLIGDVPSEVFKKR